MSSVQTVPFNMGTWEDVIQQWDNIGLQDVAVILYILFLMACVVISNSLFAQFVVSKPDGRKTAVGE